MQEKLDTLNKEMIKKKKQLKQMSASFKNYNHIDAVQIKWKCPDCGTIVSTRKIGRMRGQKPGKCISCGFDKWRSPLPFTSGDINFRKRFNAKMSNLTKEVQNLKWKISETRIKLRDLKGLSHTSIANSIKVPRLSGRIVDLAKLFSKEQYIQLDHFIAKFEKKTQGQIIVVTFKSLNGNKIKSYASAISKKWDVAKKDKGILLLICGDEKKVFLKFGMDWNNIITPQLSGSLKKNMFSFFSKKEYAKGIKSLILEIETATAK